MANKKVKELLKDKKFLEELITKNSIEDEQKLFQSYGCEISLDELTAFFKKVTASELNDEALEAVAGGSPVFSSWEERREFYEKLARGEIDTELPF